MVRIWQAYLFKSITSLLFPKCQQFYEIKMIILVSVVKMSPKSEIVKFWCENYVVGLVCSIDESYIFFPRDWLDSNQHVKLVNTAFADRSIKLFSGNGLSYSRYLIFILIIGVKNAFTFPFSDVNYSFRVIIEYELRFHSPQCILRVLS